MASAPRFVAEGTETLVVDGSARRPRRLRRVDVVAALSGAAIAYGLHHTTPFSGHRAGVALLVVAGAALVAAIPTLLVHRVERELPVILTLRPDAARLRAANSRDLDFCATLHAEVLPHGFFAQLGHRFLRAYLATFVASPHAVAVVATVNESPVGMVVGILRPAHSRWVLKHRGVRLVLLGAIALSARPRLLMRFARTRVAHYRRALTAGRAARTTSATPPAAVLSHVAVAPGAAGAGLGKRLVEAFIEEASHAGCSRVVLVTLASEEGAAGFYRRLGWIETGTHRDFDGNPMTEFSLLLPPEQR